MAAAPLKIAMLSVHSCPVGELGKKDTGGMSVYVRELARQLGRWGHLVDVYTRAHDPKDGQIVALGENARLIHLKAGDDKEMQKSAIYPHLAELACALEDFRMRNGLHYDLVHSHYWLSGCVGRWVSARWDVPHITMFHTLGAAKNTIGVGQVEPELRIASERELVQHCHRIIAATVREKGELLRYYGASPETIRVIPCGVNLELFQPVNRETAQRQLGWDHGDTILYVGRIEPLKGVDRLLLAMTYLEKRQGIKLVVIGDDNDGQPEVERLQVLSQELHIQDSVTFVGTVRQEELPRYYSAASVCVVPSYYESFGLVALESLACGTPVVSAEVGGADSVISQGRTGYVVRDNAPHCLADKIAALLSAPGNLREPVAATRASVARFSWSNIAEAIVAEYRAVLEEYLLQVGQSSAFSYHTLVDHTWNPTE